MTRFKEKVPTEAQAKRIAWLWGGGHDYSGGIKIGSYVEPTTKVLVREGWLAPTGEEGAFPNGDLWLLHKVSAKGLAALHTYLVAKGHAYGDRK